MMKKAVSGAAVKKHNLLIYTENVFFSSVFCHFAGQKEARKRPCMNLSRLRPGFQDKRKRGNGLA